MSDPACRRQLVNDNLNSKITICTKSGMLSSNLLFLRRER